MNVIFLKVARFVLNLAFYVSLLISITYYSYMNNPDLFGLKNALVPFNGALVLAVVLAISLAGINEITTFVVVRYPRGK